MGEIRYYISGKKTWNDVTVGVHHSGLPRKGQSINVGKIPMTVKDIVDSSERGKPITKVYLESSNPDISNLMNPANNPIFIILDESINEARGTIKGNTAGKNIVTSVEPFVSTGNRQWLTAGGPGSGISFGGAVRTALGSLGAGYGVSVADFGEVVTVTVTYSNAKTGRSVSQSFAIIFRGLHAKQAYTVYANVGRYRNCSDYNQAIAFIRSKLGSLPSTAAQTV
jgi:hypothetical protein